MRLDLQSDLQTTLFGTYTLEPRCRWQLHALERGDDVRGIEQNQRLRLGQICPNAFGDDASDARGGLFDLVAKWLTATGRVR
jgi:hypothetical protein